MAWSDSHRVQKDFFQELESSIREVILFPQLKPK
jgi:hypothetical protein